MDGEDSLLKEENCVASWKTCAVFNKKGQMEMDNDFSENLTLRFKVAKL